ncbi:MAG: hypothetical protein HY319_20095 [Armatimonadetes bacterium]|nr:hypothetical protein [Armatimonadota bacterium]
MSRSLGSVLIILFLALSGVYADDYEVFVNNRAFLGRTSGSPQSLWVEASAVAKFITVELEVQGESVTLHGESFPSQTQDGVVMVDAKALAQATGGRYIVNTALATIDIYFVSAPKEASAAGGSAEALVPVVNFKESGKAPEGLQERTHYYVQRVLGGIAEKNAGMIASGLRVHPLARFPGKLRPDVVKAKDGSYKQLADWGSPLQSRGLSRLPRQLALT